MELTQLKYFAAVAQLQHVTHAAEQMHVAQPAITKSVHRLEEELGVPLITSKGRNIILTEYGKALYAEIREPLEILEQLPDKMNQMKDQSTCTLQLNVLAASRVVTDAIIAYKHTHPGLSFSIVQNEQEQICDITIDTLTGKTGKADDYACFQEQVLIAVPKNSRYSQLNTISLSQLQHEEFICLAGNKKFRNICDQICMNCGFQPKIIFESDSPATVRNLIAAGSGIGFWPQFTWGEAGDDLQLLPLAGPDCVRDFSISFHPQDIVRYDTAKEFYEYLVSYFRKTFVPDHDPVSVE